MALTKNPRIVSAAVALFLAGAAAVQLWTGPESTPAPLREAMAAFLGLPTPVSARLIVAAEIALAAAVFATGIKSLALIAAFGAAFVSLACVSHGLTRGGIVMPLVCFATACISAFAALRSVPWPPRDGRRGLSPAWSALLAIGAATLAAQWTASAAFRTSEPSVAASARTDPSEAARNASESVPSIDLDCRQFLDRPLAESPLGKYLPQLAELCAGTDAYVIVYNPACESCHTLFAESFSTPRPERVIAVSIPLADGAVSAATVAARPIECASCDKLTLPAGPLWLVAPPLVLKVERGVIRCVADRFGGDCLPK